MVAAQSYPRHASRVCRVCLSITSALTLPTSTRLVRAEMMETTYFPIQTPYQVPPDATLDNSVSVSRFKRGPVHDVPLPVRQS